jgi:hypothetical protein
MRYAGYHYSETNGTERAIAALGAHPDAAKHMTAEQRAKYGEYQVLASFPWTAKGRAKAVSFCDDYNKAHFAEFSA